jgi:hypothetical protein
VVQTSNIYDVSVGKKFGSGLAGWLWIGFLMKLGSKRLLGLHLSKVSLGLESLFPRWLIWCLAGRTLQFFTPKTSAESCLEGSLTIQQLIQKKTFPKVSDLRETQEEEMLFITKT